jgi:hypothetical protein
LLSEVVAPHRIATGEPIIKEKAGQIPLECSPFVKLDICLDVIPLFIARRVISLPDSNPKKVTLQPAFRNFITDPPVRGA